MSTTTATPRLKTFYTDELKSKLKESLGIKNVNEVPRLIKIVVNVGLGAATKDGKLLEEMAKDIAVITGQKASVRRAKNSIAQFGLREEQAIGLQVTLRGLRMYEFLDRLVNVAFPRIRDFRGFSNKSFGKSGNLTVGMLEHTVFPELNIDKVYRAKGMSVTFVTTAKNMEGGCALLAGFGFPFKETRDG